MTASILSFRCVLFLFFIQPGCPPLVCFCSLSTFYTDTLCSHAWTPIKSKAWQVSDTHRDACPRCTPVALAAGPPAARPSLFNDIYADCRHLREKKITWRTVYPKLRHAYMVWMMGVVGLHHPTLRQGEISSARTHANLVKLWTTLIIARDITMKCLRIMSWIIYESDDASWALDDSIPKFQAPFLGTIPGSRPCLVSIL